MIPEFLKFFAGAIFYSVVNNIIWITGSGADWAAFKQNKFPLTNSQGTFRNRLDYVWRGRILQVLKPWNWRDYSAAILTALFLVSIWN